MAMTFSSEGCMAAANDLMQASNKLDVILSTDITNAINNVRGIYQSDTAEQLYAAFDKVKDKFPEFIQSVSDCSKYLSDTVAPAYKKVETTAAGKLS